MGTHRFLQGFRAAFSGLKDVVLNEPNMRVHLGFFAGALIAGWWLEISSIEWLAVLLCAGFVLGAECFNSALERLGDRISPENDALVGRAKDASAAAVLIAALTAALVGAFIFGPKLWSRVENWIG